MIHSLCLGEETREISKERGDIQARFLRYELEENPERKQAYRLETTYVQGQATILVKYC